MKILLVDDDSDDQELFCEAIRAINPFIKCELAVNGLDALQKLQAGFDLPEMIFVDINMPIMDGRETLNAIRSVERLKLIPVVMYTTSNNIDEINTFKKLRAGYLTKANSFEALRENLSSILAGYEATTILSTSFSTSVVS